MLHTISVQYARHLFVLTSLFQTNEEACGVQTGELGYRHMKGTAVVIRLSYCILIK